MAHKNQTLRLAFSFLLVVLCSSVAHAQFNAGIQGTVTDSNGGVVSGAKITATAQETNVSREAVTNADGFYRVDALAPGLYTLTVEAPGFKKSETKDVAVYAEQIRGVDAKLEVGEVAQTVTVNGAMAPVL